MKFRYYCILAVLSFWLGSAIIHHNHKGYFLTSDAEGYYMYLPAIFIYGTFENYPTRTPAEYHFFPNTQKMATRFTYGVALMEAPFFFAAQLSRKIQGYPTNDANANDISVALLFAACFYVTLGLYYTDRILRGYFSNLKTVYFTLIVLYFGTNLMFYAMREPTMSHAFSFCLTAALLYYLPRFYNNNRQESTFSKPSVPLTLLIGFLVGLITLIRPTNILFVVFAIFFDTYSISDIQNRFKWLWHNIKILWLIPAVCLLLALPQMYYWHYLSGKWIINVYDVMHKVTFNWTKPELFKILFHACNGFLLYTPLMFFAIIGTVWIAWKNTMNGRLILLILLIITYTFACWPMWWFGHAYGYRSFIDYYPLWGIGLGFYINWVLRSQTRWFKYLNATLFLFFIFVNIRLTITPFYWQVEPDGSRIEDLHKAINWVFDITKWN